MSAYVFVGTNIGYIALTFLPPLLWLFFYLREDCHPEPKHLIFLAFFGGMASALLAIVGEQVLIHPQDGILSRSIRIDVTPFLFFLVIGLVEEYVKYIPVKFLIEPRTDFNEPVDGMIYMMTAAMGFAAIENALFVVDIFRDNFLLGFEIITNRFLGANLLHALSSGIVGFFLARAFFHPKRHHFVALGIVLAAVLHTGFNYLILIRESLPQGTFYLILLLSTMAVMVFIDFERLKRSSLKFEPAAKNLEESNV